MIDRNLIRDSLGCDNCKHLNDGYYLDYCDRCQPGIIPSKYRPKRGSIQEKYWYDKPISETDFQKFLNRGY